MTDCGITINMCLPFAWRGIHIHVKRADGIVNVSSTIPPFSFIPIDNRIWCVCTECVRVELELLPFLGLGRHTRSCNCHIPVQASDALATALLINGRWGSRNDKNGMLPALVLLLSTAISVSSSSTFKMCVCVCVAGNYLHVAKYRHRCTIRITLLELGGRSAAPPDEMLRTNMQSRPSTMIMLHVVAPVDTRVYVDHCPSSLIHSLWGMPMIV
jgi:hypothetical protein